MLLVAGGVVLAGAAIKAPCADAPHIEGSAPTRFPCYSDLSALYRSEQLGGGRIPYVDKCRPSPQPCDEYPVLTMVVMRVAGVAAGGGADAYARFFWANVAILLACALVAVWALERLGARTILFAAAPALALYASLNWDLVAVAGVTLATWSFVEERDAAAGALLGLGAAAKLYPALLLVPFCLERLRRSREREAARIFVVALGVWLVVNAPFALLAPSNWSEFFTFNASRQADYESLWRVLCHVGPCFSTRTVNVLSAAFAAAALWWIWRVVARRRPDVPRWMMSLPLLIVVLCTTKFWSPQFGLWLLPWFALSRVPLHTFALYQAAEVLEYVTRSSFFAGSSPGAGAVTFGVLAVVLIVRAVLLLRCLRAWMRDPAPVTAAIERTPA
jgi:uncharacterized membrane protein